ncbi:MAG: FAD:protein FMN transferase [bacterium]|nr:FAD:protein FMN transferase [bacterium]
MTNWTTTSEVARINSTAGAGATVVEPEVAAVLALAGDVTAASGGAFDITVEPLVRLWGFIGGKPQVPEAAALAAARGLVGWNRVSFESASGRLGLPDPGMRIDLGGIAKGYGVDRVAALLHRAGVTDALVDLTGNMAAIGTAPGRAPGPGGLGHRHPRSARPRSLPGDHPAARSLRLHLRRLRAVRERGRSPLRSHPRPAHRLARARTVVGDGRGGAGRDGRRLVDRALRARPRGGPPRGRRPRRHRRRAARAGARRPRHAVGRVVAAAAGDGGARVCRQPHPPFLLTGLVPEFRSLIRPARR